MYNNKNNDYLMCVIFYKIIKLKYFYPSLYDSTDPDRHIFVIEVWSEIRNENITDQNFL